MTKTFGLKDVEEVMGRISPGIEEVEFTGVSDNTSDNGKYYLSINMVTLDKQREHEERFYFTTEKGERISLQRLKSLIKALLGKEKSEGEYNVAQLNAMMTGQKARCKFVGEEYENMDGELRVKTSWAFSSFAEPLTVPKEESKLRFNESKDIKKLPVAPSKRENSNTGVDAPDSDLF